MVEFQELFVANIHAICNCVLKSQRTSSAAGWYTFFVLEGVMQTELIITIEYYIEYQIAQDRDQ